MRRRPWIIQPKLVVAILAAVIFAAALGELLDIQPLGPRMPGDSIAESLLWRCMILWGLACMAVGWIQYLRKRRPPRSASLWPLTAITLALALLIAGCSAWSMYGRYLEKANQTGPFGWSSSDWLFAVFSVASPLLMGGILTMMLVTQAMVWRRPTEAGICPLCNYDLTGNVSGVCPECGTRIVSGESIPRWFFQKSYLWFPELSLLPDAQARFDAMQRAKRAYNHTIWAWGTPLMLILLAAGSFMTHASMWFKKNWWILLSILACFTVADLLRHRRIIRRNLRGEIRVRGLCPACGRTLISGKCPECGKRLT